MAPNFIETVIQQRFQRETRQQRAARALQKDLLQAQREIIVELEAMRIATDPSGRLVISAGSIQAKEAVLANVKDVVERNRLSFTDKVIKQREKELRLAAGELESNLEITMGRQLNVSFSQMDEVAAQIAANQPVLGVNPKNMAKGIAKKQQQAARSAISKGFIKGSSIKEVAAELREQLEITQTAAMRIARTNMTAASAEATRVMVEANPKTFSGYTWDATFDSRTSDICASLHGKFYAIGTQPPGPPAHWNCRSALIPVFRDAQVQADVDGQFRRVAEFNSKGVQVGRELVPTNQPFQQWLRKQPSEVSRKITGSNTKNNLFRKGKVELDDLVSPDLMSRSDAQVVQRALSRAPKDKELKSIAKELGVRPVKSATIERRERDARARADFAQGEDEIPEEDEVINQKKSRDKVIKEVNKAT